VIVPGALALLVLIALPALAAGSAPVAPQRLRAQLPAAPSAAPASCDFVNREGFTSVQRPHFGDPAKGLAVLDVWGVTCWSNTSGPVSVLGAGRGIKSLAVRRVAIQTRLYGFTPMDADPVVLKTSPIENSGDTARVVAAVTPFVDTTAYPNYDAFKVVAFVGIRWTDGTFSSVIVDGDIFLNLAFGP
jgi:hypothetical protein